MLNDQATPAANNNGQPTEQTAANNLDAQPQTDKL